MKYADRDGTAARLRSRLVRALVRSGTLTDPAWCEAFLTVPRHVFLPRYFQHRPGGWFAVDSADRDWLTPIYADRVVVTQLDGDSTRWERARAAGPVDGTPTCSSSMPTIMAVMLEALRVQDEHHVLEIGTGTGYNAALMTVRLGPRRVTTVDVDDSLARQARRNLAEIGLNPTCAVLDGVGGYPPAAPYDRVLGTCAVPRIPLTWLDQTRPGGLVVTTLNRPLGAGLVRITAGDGPTGHGEVLADDGRFMPLRTAGTPGPRWPAPDARGDTRPTALPPGVLGPASAFEFFAGLELPGVHATGATDSVVLAHPDGSWVRHESDRVTQGGPRRLWDAAEAAHAKWLDLGSPRRSRFGVTVTPRTQQLWLDDAAGEHRWDL